MIKAIALFILLGVLATWAVAEPVDQARMTRRVYCHYVAWHDWDSANKAYGRYYDTPMAHPLGDRDADYRQEFVAAKRAGIDVFVVDLVKAEIFAGHTLAMLKAAEGSDFKIAVCLDGFDLSEKEYAKRVAAFFKKVNGHPNFETVAGRPVAFTFWGYRAKAEWWKNFRTILKDEYQQDIFIVGDPDSMWNVPATPEGMRKHTGAFDALYSFAEVGRDGKQTPAESHQVFQQAAMSESIARQWVGSVSPGYTGAWPLNGRNDYYIPFRGFDLFIENYEAALKLNADSIGLCTWNDLDETPLQPMMFQFRAYEELSRYYVDTWRGQKPVASEPRVYVAYQREQMVGTLQRIEAVSLPARVAGDIELSCDLLDESGKMIASLPSMKIPADQMIRREWIVDTTPLAMCAAVTPRLKIASAGNQTVRTLPLFRLRTGWIENKVVVRLGAHEMGSGKAVLNVRQDRRDLSASVQVESADPVIAATLWRNDRPVGSFRAAGGDQKVSGFLFQSLPQCKLKLSVAEGEILEAYLTSATIADMSKKYSDKIQWNKKEIEASIDPHTQFAVRIAGGDEARATIQLNQEPPTEVLLAGVNEFGVELRKTGANAAPRMSRPVYDPLAALPDKLHVTGGTLAGQWKVDEKRPTDLFYVRLETAGGKTFFSQAVTPFVQDHDVKTRVIQTCVALDMPAQAYLSSELPFREPTIAEVKVHPACVQGIAWSFSDREARDTMGRLPLYPGSARNNYGMDAKRAPGKVYREDGQACLSFDGRDDLIETPIRQMPLGAFDVSMEIYNKRDKRDVTQTLLASVGFESKPVLRILPGGILEGGQKRGTSDGVFVQSRIAVPEEKWTSLRMTYDLKEVVLYIDHEEVGRIAAPLKLTRYGNSRQYIGGTPGGDYFAGYIRDIRIESIVK